MSWNNRILLHKDPNGDWYGIHEVYYDEEGKPWGWTTDAVKPFGENVDELLASMRQMLSDAEKAKDDIIDYDSKPEGKSMSETVEEDLKSALEDGEITQEEYDEMMKEGNEKEEAKETLQNDG